MKTKREAPRIGLGIKLNIMLIVCILVFALGFLQISYRIYCHKVDNFYYTKAEHVVYDIASYHLPYGYTAYLREMTDTDEFRQVRARAIEANDEQIIKDWMLEQPSYDYLKGYVNPDFSLMTEKERERYTLYGDYDVLVNLQLAYAEEIFHVDTYIQYVVDGVTYNLADSDMSLMEIGTPEEPIEAFAKYTGNDRIPPTIYQFGNDWLCTTCEPILEEWEGIEDVALAQVCVDIDMNDVIKERHWFLVKSAQFITAFTLAVMALALLLTGKLATTPLKQLAQGAARFKMRDEGFSKDDVIELPIHSKDEIGDLYHEIKLMQERIVNNADKLTHAIAERERVNTELDLAAHIQSNALPKQFPAFPDRPEFDLYASMDPAKEVGGDFYDYFLVDDDHLALVIADASDKGVPAALFMMSAKYILHYRAGMGGTPGEIMTSVNKQLCRDNPLMMFVTVWFSILELSTGRLACSNAGHEFPIIRHPGDAFTPFTDQHEIVMGIMKEISYSEYEICLEPGSKVFVYTDGLAEAQNAQEEQFGLDRIVEALNVAPDISPRELLDNMRRAVDTFVGGAPQFDDLTMLCIEYKGPGKAEAAATWQ